MPARTVKGHCFTIIVDGKRIVVKHVSAKGKCCRVIAPADVFIVPSENDFDGVAPWLADKSAMPN